MLQGHRVIPLTLHFNFNQLLKAWGAYVASTCSPDAVDLVAGLGADLVVDYSAVNAKEELKISGG